MMESSGNRGYSCGQTSRGNKDIHLYTRTVPCLEHHWPGVDTVQTNLHMGLPGSSPHWSNATLKVNTREDFAEEFHTYELDWTKHHLAFSVGRKYFFVHRVKIFADGEEVYRLKAPGPDGGLFEYAGLPGENIWAGGGPMAPFDKPFYLIISVQTGHT